jgi:3-deoxy-D-arabino-heptulosonate 7-phosphate (DAHP) synthase
MEYVEEFTADGKDIIYIDFSRTASEKDFNEAIEQAKRTISKHAEKSVCTITNMENVRFDSNIKEVFVKYVESNKPYVKYGVAIGMDGIKKKMIEGILKLGGRPNFHFCFTKEEAVKWLRQQL